MKTLNAEYSITILATPIGNLDEITPRFINTISSCDVLLCEDTRVTKKLLNLVGVNKNFKFIKFELYSENDNINVIIDMIKSGVKIGLLSDAGYPGISDPGYKLIHECIKQQIAINVVNGPSSLVHALVASGFCQNEFLFLGFLGKNSHERIKKIQKYSNLNIVFVIFESRHRLKECLKDLYVELGNQNIAICRELTKLHEEFIYSNLQSIQTLELDIRGEFVLVIDNQPPSKSIISDNDIAFEIKQLLDQNYKTKEISKIIAQKYNLSSKEIYQKILKTHKI